MAPAVVLIGSPGAGKSSVGRRVAERLKVSFVDTDQVVEQEAGMSVADIFVTHGEDEFRRLEAAAVAGCLEGDGVVALGGGAVLRDETQQRLKGHRVVWLKVNLSDAAARVGLNTARPLLLGNVRGTLHTLMEQRTPVYAAVASASVETSGRSLREVTDDVVAVVNRD